MNEVDAVKTASQREQLEHRLLADRRWNSGQSRCRQYIGLLIF